MRSPTFKRIASGLYINHEWGMSIERERVYNKYDGPKWEAQWKVWDCVGVSTRSKDFDSYLEALRFLKRLAKEGRVA